MPKTIKVPMDDAQFGKAIDLLSQWEDDDKKNGLVELSESDLTEEEKEKGIIKLIVSRSITVPQWEEFCKKVGIQEPFP